MLDQHRLAAQPDQKREKLFTERYECLLAWALRLTNQNRDTAEDLVQDAFVQFILGRTRLEEIENIDGYLRRMLRYMHLSQISRATQHLHDTALSIADYDSFRLSRTAIEPSRRLQAAEELRQICAYACSRKESSRAGSVLILRFFHDYFPTEIASILNSSRHCADQWQQLARREVKLFINEPSRLRFVAAKATKEPTQIKRLGSDCDLMVELCQIIFNSCQSACLSKKQLQEIYVFGDAEALSTARLAHIVSCRSCLDAVNSLLGLPLLAQRRQADPCDKEGPPSDTTGGSASGRDIPDLRARYEHRLREVGEHKPHELRIAVNGSLVGSLKVSSDLSELNLNLPQEKQIEFVEVFSEQGVQLLFFSIRDEIGSEAEQWAWIELSEGRTMEACLRLEHGPSLHIVYKEPVPEQAFANLGALNGNALSSPPFIPHRLVKTNVSRSHQVTRLRSLAERFFRIFKVEIERPRVAEEIEPRAFGDALTSLTETRSDKAYETSFLTLLGQSSKGSRKPVWMRPKLLTALLSAVVIAAFLFFKVSSGPTLTATNLLAEAKIAEQLSTQIPDQVSHRVINLEERRSAEGAVVSRRKIEIWQNSARGDRAVRLYDENNQLIGGVWQKANGSRTVFHHHAQRADARPRLLPHVAPVTTDNLLLNPEDIWQLEPSAKEFSALIAESADARLEQRATSYFISHEKERAIGASRLLKATLTLSRSDLHAIEQTLLVQRGGELWEYRFVEANFERLSAKVVAPAVFEVEPDLTGGAGPTSKSGNWANRDLTSSPVSPSSTTSTPPVASAELEVDVAYLLNQAKADRNEQITLTRTANDLLRVEGVVDTIQRKQELLGALAPVSNNRAVKIEIVTVSEALERLPRRLPGDIIVRETEETANTVAVDDELRAYLSRRDPVLTNGSGLDEGVRSFSSRIVNRAYRALFHAIELKQLMDRFGKVDMRTVTPQARSKWLEMVREHARAFEQESAVLREQIQPIFFSGTLLNSDELEIKNDADLGRAVQRLHKLALPNNQAIRAAFTISSQSSAAAIKSAEFWRALVGAENLAARIKQYQG